MCLDWWGVTFTASIREIIIGAIRILSGGLNLPHFAMLRNKDFHDHVSEKMPIKREDSPRDQGPVQF